MVFKGIDEAVVVDIETTGLNPKEDRIISVAMVRARFSRLKQSSDGLHGDTMDAIVNPQCRIPFSASRIHGIMNKHVEDKGPFSEVAQQLRDFIGDRPIIAHNASFDKSFLNAEFKRAGVKTLARNRSYCTMRRFQDFNHGLRRGSNLDNVADVMGVTARSSTRHDATEDVRIVCAVAGLIFLCSTSESTKGIKRAVTDGQAVHAAHCDDLNLTAWATGRWHVVCRCFLTLEKSK